MVFAVRTSVTSVGELVRSGYLKGEVFIGVVDRFSSGGSRILGHQSRTLKGLKGNKPAAVQLELIFAVEKAASHALTYADNHSAF